MKKCLSLALSVSLAATAEARSQTNWFDVTPAATPPSGYHNAMAFDSRRGVSVAFGGNAGPTNTCEWDGATWTEHVIAYQPSERWAHAMTFDSLRGRTVLYGGIGPGGLFQDTWEWDGNVWVRAFPSRRPSASFWMTIAYDSYRHVTVLFGGANLSRDSTDETWEWDGIAWTQRHPVHSPSPRHVHGMAYDQHRRVTVVYGGTQQIGGATAVLLSDTWEWNGDDWALRSSSNTPGERASPNMMYDSRRRRVVMFGGWKPPRNAQNDTWEWDGRDWVEILPSTSPTPRQTVGFAYDSARGVGVMFGNSGIRDTWEYAPVTLAAATSYGAGCAGSAGTPVLAPSRELLPWIGETFETALYSIPGGPVSTPFLVAGFSNAAWGSTPLPLNLSSIGMTGCSLYASAEDTFVLVNTGGLATWTAPIPAQRSLMGQPLFIQGLVLDVFANPLGVTVSNALELTLGYR